MRVRGKEKERKNKSAPEAERERYRQKDAGAKFREVVTVQPVGPSPRPHDVGTREKLAGCGSFGITPKLGDLKHLLTAI